MRLIGYASLAAITALCASCSGDLSTQISRDRAATDAVHLPGESVLHAPNDPSFVESGRQIRLGSKTPSGGCRFGGRRYLKRGEYAAERVVEINPVTCDYVVASGMFNHAVGALGDRAPAASMMDDYDYYSQDVTTLSAAGGSNRGWQRVWWYDPVTLEVVSQRLETWFDYNYTCLLSPLGTASAKWLRETGWRKTVFDAAGQWGNTCATAYFQVYGTYDNNQWCYPGSATVEIFMKSTLDAIGGIYYDHWENKEATNFFCNTLWSSWEAG